jgi:ubiquinone/menaquinone biosynthesis C-methylase UbiE
VEHTLEGPLRDLDSRSYCRLQLACAGRVFKRLCLHSMSVERLDPSSSTDRLQLALHRARYDLALKNVQGATAVLEIGTGCGELSEELSKLPSKYVGVEIDACSAEHTRSRVHNAAEIVVADARSLPFRDQEFSHAICMEVLEHLGN